MPVNPRLFGQPTASHGTHWFEYIQIITQSIDLAAVAAVVARIKTS